MNFEDLSVKQVRELTQSQLDLVAEKFDKKLYDFLVECKMYDANGAHTIKASEQKHVHLNVKSINLLPVGNNDDLEGELYYAQCTYCAGLTYGQCLALFLYQNDKMYICRLVFDSWNNPMAPRINFK